MRELTFNDVKDMLNMRGNALDVFAAVARRGKEIFDYGDHHHRGGGGGGEASAAATSKKRKYNFQKVQQPVASSVVPQKFLNAIQEMARGKTLTSPATLVIEKRLFCTDVSHSHNRLSIPMSQMIRRDDGFLTDEEKRFLKSYEDPQKTRKNFKEVRIIAPSLELETAHLCRWDMPKRNCDKMSYSYNINGNWSRIVWKNNLTKYTKVQLWAFRVDRELCFALINLTLPN